MADFEQLKMILIKGSPDELMVQVKSALDGGSSADEILKEGLISGMDIVGARMESGEMFIPEVLRSAKCMSQALETLRPLLSADQADGLGKIVIGTVKGDLHDIGKNLVKMLMESAGFQVTDLGVDATPEAFVRAVKEKNAHIVAMSALLTTTMPMMKATVDAMVEAGLKANVKVLIGGAPVTQKFADDIGADGYASDASSATRMAKSLIG